SHEDARGGSSLTSARLELVARECPGPDCALRVSSFSSTAADFTAVVDGADDQRVTGIQIFMQQPAGLASRGDAGFVLPRFGMQLIMGYSVSGRHIIDAKNTADTDGLLDFDTGEFELSSSFPSAGATITLSLRGNVENFPPVANAGSDAAAECTSPSGALVSLDGSGSSDRAPGPGLASHLWFEGFDPDSGSGFSVATGATPAVQLGKGPHVLTLVAQDGSGALDLDDVAIDVRDRTAPRPSCAGETKECTGPLTDVVTTCSAVDACDVEPVVSSDAEEVYPVGSHSFTCSASDDDGNSASAACEVVVTDTTPPVIQPSGTGQLTACHGDPQVFNIPFPVVSDLCSASGVIGELVSVGGRVLDAAVPVPDSGQLLLPAGGFTIRWSALDEHGNQSSLDQSFSVQIVESASCCAAGQTLVEGTAGQDNLHLNQTADYCVLAFASKDVVKTQDGNDHVFGGSGDDVLQCGGGADSVFGGAGADTINSVNGGQLVVHGGPANDVIQAGSATTALLWAGLGDDTVQGSPGSDTIYPGDGRDVTNGHGGDDTVVLLDECEAVRGKVLQGGPGRDTLVIPLSLAELLARGIVVNGFEVIVVDRSKAYLSECF
ncbi:MAG TPA: calcium-binding protein, partial [Polyangiaceae bacterium]